MLRPSSSLSIKRGDPRGSRKTEIAKGILLWLVSLPACLLETYPLNQSLDELVPLQLPAPQADSFQLPNCSGAIAEIQDCDI